MATHQRLPQMDLHSSKVGWALPPASATTKNRVSTRHSFASFTPKLDKAKCDDSTDWYELGSHLTNVPNGVRY